MRGCAEPGGGRWGSPAERELRGHGAGKPATPERTGMGRGTVEPEKGQAMPPGKALKLAECLDQCTPVPWTGLGSV